MGLLRKMDVCQDSLGCENAYLSQSCDLLYPSLSLPLEYPTRWLNEDQKDGVSMLTALPIQEMPRQKSSLTSP